MQVIIDGLIEHWPARRKWGLDYFEQQISQPVSGTPCNSSPKFQCRAAHALTFRVRLSVFCQRCCVACGLVCIRARAVNLTPDGRADSAKLVEGQEAFVYPAEESMSFSEFRYLLERRQEATAGEAEHDCIPYISHQVRTDSM